MGSKDDFADICETMGTDKTDRMEEIRRPYAVGSLFTGSILGAPVKSDTLLFLPRCLSAPYRANREQVFGILLFHSFTLFA